MINEIFLSQIMPLPQNCQRLIYFISKFWLIHNILIVKVNASQILT